MKEYKVESSNIKTISYDLKKKKLIVCFNNDSCYAYDNICSETVCNLMFADSIGKEFHDSIKACKALKL